MKTLSYLFLIMFLASVTACGHKGKPKENVGAFTIHEVDTTLAKTTLKFTATEHDFGQVKEGEKVVHIFEVLNTGKADLVLQSVRPSCGCTTPNYDKKPIRPGKKGKIEVMFDTKRQPGKQRKSIMVITNTDPPNTVLSFTCEVIQSENSKNQ